MIASNRTNPTATMVLVARNAWIQAAAVLAFALLTALGAHIRVPLPGTPVPMTLQTVFVLLAGITLGARLGTLSMALYLLFGIAGHHVFAAATWSQDYLFGATGGYLLGFVLAQPVLGRIVASTRASYAGLLAAVLSANLVIFGVGLIWLKWWLGLSLEQTLALGLWPFLPALALKIAVVVPAGKRLRPLAEHRRIDL